MIGRRLIKEKHKLRHTLENLFQVSIFSTAFGTSLVYFLAFLLIAQYFTMGKLSMFQSAEVAIKCIYVSRGYHSILLWVCSEFSLQGSWRLLVGTEPHITSKACFKITTVFDSKYYCFSVIISATVLFLGWHSSACLHHFSLDAPLLGRGLFSRRRCIWLP